MQDLAEEVIRHLRADDGTRPLFLVLEEHNEVVRRDWRMIASAEVSDGRRSIKLGIRHLMGNTREDITFPLLSDRRSGMPCFDRVAAFIFDWVVFSLTNDDGDTGRSLLVLRAPAGSTPEEVLEEGHLIRLSPIGEMIFKREELQNRRQLYMAGIKSALSLISNQ